MLVLILLLGFLVGMVIALVLAISAIVVALGRGRQRSAMKRLGAASLLVAGAAVGTYAWGMGHLAGAVLEAEDGGTDSSPLRPCREAGAEKAAQVIDYGVDLVPLRFNCHRLDGESYATSSVPGYINPTTAILGLTALTSLLYATTRDRPSQRSQDSKSAGS